MLKKQCTKLEYDKEISQIVKKQAMSYMNRLKKHVKLSSVFKYTAKADSKRWWVLQAFC